MFVTIDLQTMHMTLSTDYSQ